MAYEAFIKDFELALNDENIKNILIRGYDNNDKIRAVMSVLSKKYDRGIFLTSSITDVPRLYGENVGLKMNRVKQNNFYKYLDMKVTFKSYDRNAGGPAGMNDEQFALFYPVEGYLFEPKLVKKLVKQVQDAYTDKNILVTTNDFSTRAEQLYPFMDKVLIIDTNEIHPEQLEALKVNLAADSEELPY